MGLDISKIVNAELKKIAYIKDDGDGNLNQTEFNLFKQDAAKANVSAEDFCQAMGLYTTSDKKSDNIKEELKKDNTKLSKYEKECRNAVLNNVKSYLDKPSITLSNLVETLKKDFGDEDYQKYANADEQSSIKRDSLEQQVQEMLDTLQPQMLQRAQIMCEANGVEFDMAVFTTIFNNAKGTAISNAIVEKKVGIFELPTFNAATAVNEFTSEFAKSYSEWVEKEKK